MFDHSIVDHMSFVTALNEREILQSGFLLMNSHMYDFFLLYYRTLGTIESPPPRSNASVNCVPDCRAAVS